MTTNYYYTNEGRGLVLKNGTTAALLADLFVQKPTWTSVELNDRLGWQFSQAVFSLRQKGYDIKTVRIGPRRFCYTLEGLQVDQVS